MPMFEENRGVLQIRVGGAVQESSDRKSVRAWGTLEASRKPPLRMIEGRVVKKRSGPGLQLRGENPGVGALRQIEDAHRLVHEILDIQYMSVAVGKAGIDVVVHRAGRELDLEVGLVLKGIAALRRVGVVIHRLIVAVEVIIESVVDDAESIRGLEGLDDLPLGVQRMRAGTRRLVDVDPGIERNGSGQIDLRAEARDPAAPPTTPPVR